MRLKRARFAMTLNRMSNRGTHGRRRLPAVGGVSNQCPFNDLSELGRDFRNATTERNDLTFENGANRARDIAAGAEIGRDFGSEPMPAQWPQRVGTGVQERDSGAEGSVLRKWREPCPRYRHWARD